MGLVSFAEGQCRRFCRKETKAIDDNKSTLRSSRARKKMSMNSRKRGGTAGAAGLFVCLVGLDDDAKECPKRKQTWDGGGGGDGIDRVADSG